ncbi:hypothetical protein Patl1_34087 [Pistacia atlantica]|uniref:Uncharacterized protein n=1 Tax=Pistacia atlantica TaxID=434234 RepID=A0ACC0ZT26_9ROSI|nr:hypothetical protein Patl1_34087 [Pistacia atlantica]
MPSESISAENLLKFTLRPHAQLGFDRTNIPSLVAPSQIMDELLSEIPEIVDAAQHVSQFWQEHTGTKEAISPVQENELMIEEPWLDENRLPSCLENVRKDDLEIVLLGTGSSQPSKYRNVSSIYINLFSKGSLLLDFGEGTLGQLKRRYGVEVADNAVRNLSPAQPKRFLHAYQRLEDLDMQFLNCRYTTEASWNDFECNGESNKDPSTQGSADNNENLNHKNVIHTESNLFAKGSRMQSFWKRPGSPVDRRTAFPLLKSLKKVLSEAGLETLILGTGMETRDTSPSVLFFIDEQIFIFNAGEATFEGGMVKPRKLKRKATAQQKKPLKLGQVLVVYTPKDSRS